MSLRTVLVYVAAVASLASASAYNCVTGCDAENETLPYKNASLSIDERLDDLLKRMTIEEKAGQLFQPRLYMGDDYTIDEGVEGGEQARNSTEFMINTQQLSHFSLTSGINDVEKTAKWYNKIQDMAAQTRLGIPVTISSDPRHAYTDNSLLGFQASLFSQWPETTGLAAIRDVALVQKFAEMARAEYVAVGLRTGLHPQIDLATDYRWPRISGTFGEDADLTSEMAVAYLKGFNGAAYGNESVTTVVKHFPGGGPMEHGEDSHFAYGQNQTYPGGNFEYFLEPFKAAIANGARAIMPGYGRPIGTKYPEVAFAFNKPIITDLLRNEMGFAGLVITDWQLITDTTLLGLPSRARAYGVEHLGELERMEMILDAGCDQFGGESRPELLTQLIEEKRVSEERLNVSVRRILYEKFALGLFDNPFVDAKAAVSLVGNEEFTKAGRDAQRRSYTLLTNKDDFLPIKGYRNSTAKAYLEGVDSEHLTNLGIEVVSEPSEADFAILRMGAPYTPRFTGTELFFRAGSLEYTPEEKARQAAIYKAVPTIVEIKMDRPAAIPEIAEGAAALFASYGADQDALIDVIFGVAAPEGSLPFDLPRSNQAVEESFVDVPFDTKDPVFRFGHGLRYKAKCAPRPKKN